MKIFYRTMSLRGAVATPTLRSGQAPQSHIHGFVNEELQYSRYLQCKIASLTLAMTNVILFQ
ncbi:MAG: hypothetical protein A3B68_08100 [Candidatus Melainabacteria bacterium RIFCSPHIGHO2_02_FULL_34_12]|nr:MAG: hypothetical protein A3B68_08100 [Candidatus Melainabacteria bacterium RIFCSPHIGHO2_02_FULL_34_12]